MATNYASVFEAQLTSTRFNLYRNKKIPKYKKLIRPMLYPWAKEIAYAKAIKQWILPLVNYTQQYLEAHHPAILKGDSTLKLDALPGNAFDLLRKTLAGWAAIHFPSSDTAKIPEIMVGLGEYANQVKSFNGKEWQKQLVSQVGFEFNTDEKWWPAIKERWAQTNYKLIKSLTDNYIANVNDLTEKAVTQGWSWTDLYTRIKNTGANITGARARLIARDQVGKLNGQITQAEMEDIGLDTYIWRTANDERVRGRPGGLWSTARPSHWVMEGKLCKWSDASVWSEDDGKTWVPRSGSAPMAAPGSEIQCRCTAVPSFNQMISLIDRRIAAAA